MFTDPSNNDKDKKKSSLNREAFKHAISMVESSGGKYLDNPNSSAAGRYHFLWNLIKNDPDLKGYSKKDFIRNKQLQEMIMDKALDGKLKGYTYGEKYASKLIEEYGSDMDVNDASALLHFLGPGNLRKYFRSPQTFKVPGTNLSAEKYVSKFRKYFNEFEPELKKNETPKQKELKEVQVDNTAVKQPTLKQEFTEDNTQPKDNFVSLDEAVGLVKDENGMALKPEAFKQQEVGDLHSYLLSKGLEDGGDMMSLFPEASSLVTKFEGGGTHEENSLGGIPQGVNKNGQVNLVEEGETKWNDYIFSNSITLDGKFDLSTNVGLEDGGDLTDPFDVPAPPDDTDPPEEVKSKESEWIDDFVDNAEFLKKPAPKELPKIESQKESAKSDRLLKVGTKGTDVKSIQAALGIESDGIFGKQTREAVKEFQRKNNLKVDGIVGQETIGAINKMNSNSYKGYKSDRDNLMNAMTRVDATSVNQTRAKDLDTFKSGPMVEAGSKISEEDEYIERNGVKRKARSGIAMPVEKSALREGFNNLIPSSARTLINDVAGNFFEKEVMKRPAAFTETFSPITEEHITNNQFNILNSFTKELLKQGKTSIKGYDDWRKIAGMSGESIEDGLYLDNEVNTIAQVLGQARIEVDDNGNVFVEDTYNFNDAYDKEGKRATYEELDKKRSMDLAGEEGVSKAIYSMARNTGAVYGSGEGFGAPVSMMVGNINDMGLSKKELEKIKKLYGKKGS